MATSAEEVGLLASYLSVSYGKTNKGAENEVPQILMKNGSTLKGLASICKYLVRQSNHKQLLGNSVEEQAAIAQWLEYRCTHVSRCEEEKDLYNMLQDLDSYLSDKVYFVGYEPTLADIVLYYGLHPIMSKLTFYQKQQYMNVSRWFDNVQHLPRLRQNLNKMHFSKTVLYTGTSH